MGKKSRKPSKIIEAKMNDDIENAKEIEKDQNADIKKVSLNDNVGSK